MSERTDTCIERWWLWVSMGQVAFQKPAWSNREMAV